METESKIVINHPSLAFLEGKRVLYYAGLDYKSLPFGEAQQVIATTANKHHIHLKALSLFSDYVVVPPTFFFQSIPVNHSEGSNYVGKIRNLYEMQAIISPVYSNMSSTMDFIKYKKESGSDQEMELIKKRSPVLNELFSSIPLLKRDVATQSSDFRDTFMQNIGNLRSIPRSLITDKIEQEASPSLIALSRDDVIPLLDNLYIANLINKTQYKRLYYAMNKAYYIQGANTYGADISCLNSERYYQLKKDIFSAPTGRIMVAYDPEVILLILSAHGIDEWVLDLISDKDLDYIKRSLIHQRFLQRYESFANELQCCITAAGKLTKSQLIVSKNEIYKRFQREYISGSKIFQRKKRILGLIETGAYTIMGSGLGYATVGFFIEPLFGLLQGIIPLLLHGLGITPRISEMVIERIDKSEMVFANYIQMLTEIKERLEKEAKNTMDSYS